MTDRAYETHAKYSLNASSTIELVVLGPAPFHDMLFIPSVQAIIPLCEQRHDSVLREAERLGNAMAKVEDAQQTLTDWRAERAANKHSMIAKDTHQAELQRAIHQAQEDLRDLLTHYVWPGLDEPVRQARLRQADGLFNAQKPLLTEVYSLTNKRLLWVSTDTLKELSTRIQMGSSNGETLPNLYRIPPSGTNDQNGSPHVQTLTPEVFNRVEQNPAQDALRPWRDSSSAQALSQTDFVASYEKVATQVALDWNLGQLETQGTASSRLVLKAVSPRCSTRNTLTPSMHWFTPSTRWRIPSAAAMNNGARLYSKFWTNVCQQMPTSNAPKRVPQRKGCCRKSGILSYEK